MSPPPGAPPSVLVVGAAHLDVRARSHAAVRPGTSNPGRTVTAPGGVGRNVAETLARLGTGVRLVAAVGRDTPGEEVLARTRAAGVDVTRVLRLPPPAVTGSYTAVLDQHGELVVAVADTAATEQLGPDTVAGVRDLVAAARLLVLEGNLPADTVRAALALAAELGVATLLDPVSVPKAERLRPALAGQRLHTLTPTQDELAALTGMPTGSETEVWAAAETLRSGGVTSVWVRRGTAGSLLVGPDGCHELAAEPAEAVDVTGAGDAMLGAYAHGLVTGAAPVDAARRGHRAAALTVASTHTVPPDLTARSLDP